MQAGLNGTQFRIVLAIWRYTYGFNRKSHNISLAFLADVTNTNKQQVGRELKKLIDMRVITEVQSRGLSQLEYLSLIRIIANGCYLFR